MATERAPALAALIVVAAAVAGCTTINKCRSKTLLVTVTLDATIASADALEIDISIDGMTTTSNLDHSAGSTEGTVEVRFPTGYPAGKSADITVVAKQGGSPIGKGQTSVLLSQGCAVAGLSVSGGGVDLAGGASEMTVATDLTGATMDLTGVTMDLTGAKDLTAAIDLAMCASSMENCFNGIDDNCDGLVDCADPQCTGGATPIAECVPDPGSAPAGTLSATTCPTAYPTDTPLYATLTAGSCATGSCACFNGFSGPTSCAANLVNKGASLTACDVGFGGTTIFSGVTNASGCFSFTGLSGTTNYQLSYTTSGSCNVPSGGSSSKIAPTWGTTNAFCGGGAVGKGCAGGQVCMPVAPNHCVVETGSQVACTVSGYSVQNSTQFFANFDDTGRACSCVCTPGVTCNASFFTNGSCNTGPFGAAAGCYKNWAGYTGVTVPAPGGSCGPGAAESGATSTTGFERTVCCTN